MGDTIYHGKSESDKFSQRNENQRTKKKKKDSRIADVEQLPELELTRGLTSVLL